METSHSVDGYYGPQAALTIQLTQQNSQDSCQISSCLACMKNRPKLLCAVLAQWMGCVLEILWECGLDAGLQMARHANAVSFFLLPVKLEAKSLFKWASQPSGQFATS